MAGAQCMNFGAAQSRRFKKIGRWHTAQTGYSIFALERTCSGGLERKYMTHHPLKTETEIQRIGFVG